MRRALPMLAALLLVALPVAAQTPAPRIPTGTIGVFVQRWDGTRLEVVGEPIIVPPMCPLPGGVS